MTINRATADLQDWCSMNESNPGHRELVVFADDWGRHPSSCQRLIQPLREEYRILWVNTIGTRQPSADRYTLKRGLEKLGRWLQGIERVGKQMWTIDLPMLPGLSGLALVVNKRLVAARLRRAYARLGLAAPAVLTTLPFAGWLIDGLPRRALVYYCTDDYSNWPSSDWKALRQAEAEMSGQANLILAASRALFTRHEASSRCRYFPHGVDFQHFASTRQARVVPPSLSRLPGPRIGFFGLVYEKLDFGLLAEVAWHFPQASVVLIGRVAYCPTWLAELPNLYLLGPRSYEELPGYLAGLDVLLLPYVNDDFIAMSCPMKLRECLASGKPTVSVDVPECRALQPHVRIARGPNAFLEHVRQALAEPPDSSLVSARQRAVQYDTWQRRADLLRSYLTEAESWARKADHTALRGPHSFPDQQYDVPIPEGTKLTAKAGTGAGVTAPLGS
jgi:glycosyltransferase involved in cell wall biosynthesis